MVKRTSLNLTRYFDFNSAYGQLLLLVFIPVSVLATVGAYLVLQHTADTTIYKQEAIATGILMRYESEVRQMLPQLLQQASLTSQTMPLTSQDQTLDSFSQITLNAEQLATMQAILTAERHVNRLAVIDESGRILTSIGVNTEASWGISPPLTTLSGSRIVGEHDDAEVGPGHAYGHLLGEYDGAKYWLFIDMDDEPLYIAWLQVLLTVGALVLICTLLLLLALNVFSKRWIVPIYNMRLHLQQTTSNNLYKPITSYSGGELNLLQQDLAKTLRRLHSDFQELKNHAEQTESDLQLAFDEMEMRNINNRRARDMAVSASEAKSAFLANISHELRTPLNSIDGFINLLSRHGELTAEQDLYVQTIRKSSAHLLALVNDVLDFSKIEAGKLLLDNHEFSLYDAIYDVMDMLSPLASEKGLSMAVLYYNDVPAKITGDALRVKQVLTNLVSNAIKFTDTGSVVVRVSLEDDMNAINAINTIVVLDSLSQQLDITHDNESTSQQNTEMLENRMLENRTLENSKQEETQGTDAQSKNNQGEIIAYPSNRNEPTNSNSFNSGTSNTKGMPNTKIVIAVEDTGRGVTAEEQDKLFQSFSQGDPSITRQYGGTGLGLTISKQLTRLMGGEIGFYDNATHQSQQRGQNSKSDTDQNNTLARNQGSTFWFTISTYVDVIALMEDESDDNKKSGGHGVALPVLNQYASHKYNTLPASSAPDKQPLNQPYQMLVWLINSINLRVLRAALDPLDINMVQANSLAGALDQLEEQSNRWDWVIIDNTDTQGDMAALLKQIRLHYQGKLAIFGYQVALDAKVMTRYKAHGLYQPLDKRQLYRILDTRISSDSKHAAPVSQWEGVTVLAVDDHPPNLLVLEALLNELGIKVITANSGFEAVDIISKQLTQDASLEPQTQAPIDLIFMDLQMPRMSGHEATKQIRQIEQSLQGNRVHHENDVKNKEHKQALGGRQSKLATTAHIPIIALSAHGLSDERDRLIASGIDDYVSKPISQARLLQLLQRWLTDASTSQTLLETQRGNKTQGQSQSQPQSQLGEVKAITPEAQKTQSLGKQMAGEDSSNTSDNVDDINNDSDYFGAGNLGTNPIDNQNRVQSLPIIDWEDALTRSANKPDLAIQLFTMLQDTLTDEINELQDAWKLQDRYQLAQIAHRILGASRYTGVPQLRAASQDFEDKSMLDVQRVTPVQFAILQPYFDTLIMALKNLQDVDLTQYPELNKALQADSISENEMTWKMI